MRGDSSLRSSRLKSQTSAGPQKHGLQFRNLLRATLPETNRKRQMPSAELRSGPQPTGPTPPGCTVCFLRPFLTPTPGT